MLNFLKSKPLISKADIEFQVASFKWLLKNFGGDDFYKTKHLYKQRLNGNEDMFLSPYTDKEGVVKDQLYCIDADSLKDKPICLSTL